MQTETAKNPQSFKYSIKTSKSPETIFEMLLDVEQWWSGIYGEKIEGTSEKIGDEFIFTAGNGAHYSKQKLVELIPNQRITWLVTDSNLKSLADPHEWNNTTLCFEIAENGGETTVVFTHEGLNPQIECYDRCTGGWTRYLEKFAGKLN